MRLEFLHGFVRIVHQGEASALATTVLRTEAEDVHLVLVGLVEVGNLLAELIFGDVGAVGVEDVTVGRRSWLDLWFFIIIDCAGQIPSNRANTLIPSILHREDHPNII